MKVGSFRFRRPTFSAATAPSSTRPQKRTTATVRSRRTSWRHCTATRVLIPSGGNEAAFLSIFKGTLPEQILQAEFLSILQADFQLASGFVDRLDRIGAVAVEVVFGLLQVNFGIVQGFQGRANFWMPFKCRRRH